MSRAAAPAAGGGAAAGAHGAAHAEAILVDRPDVAALRLEGKDALDLLHRLTTNDLKSLAEGAGAATVFTTAKGRILDLVTVHRHAGGLHLLCDAARVEAIMGWIDRYTFREEVRVEDRRASHATLCVCGPRALGVVGRAFPAVPALERHAVAAVDLDGEEGLWVRTFPVAADAWLLTAPQGALASARARLLAAGAGRLMAAPLATFETLRIEAGLPAAGRELTEDHNPWEARLDDAVSLSKGCYVGQEVIARLNTYRKVSRLLVRLEADGEAVPAGAAIAAGAETIGLVTSSTVLPDGGRMLALGYVRDEDAVAGKPVTIATDAGPRKAIIAGPAR